MAGKASISAGFRPQTPQETPVFWTRKISPDDLGRLDRLEERQESLIRRFESLSIENEEFYMKTNKARQRVNKEETDRLRANGGPVAIPITKAELRAQLFARRA